jgi:hypothetical protein
MAYFLVYRYKAHPEAADQSPQFIHRKFPQGARWIGQEHRTNGIIEESFEIDFDEVLQPMVDMLDAYYDSAVETKVITALKRRILQQL